MKTVLLQHFIEALLEVNSCWNAQLTPPLISPKALELQNRNICKIVFTLKELIYTSSINFFHPAV